MCLSPLPGLGTGSSRAEAEPVPGPVRSISSRQDSKQTEADLQQMGSAVVPGVADTLKILALFKISVDPTHVWIRSALSTSDPRSFPI